MIGSARIAVSGWAAAAPLRVPLRIGGRRFWLWGMVCGVLAAAVSSNAHAFAYSDFPQFWAAGRTVGSASLLDPGLHAAWQAANGVTPSLFAYTPGTAWLFAPFALFSIATGFWLHAAVMTVLVGVAGFLVGRALGLQGRVGLVAAYAWGPCMFAVAFGQNTPLALLLVTIAIEGLRRDSDALAGIGVGLLLYKPTLAIPLLVLLLLRRRWQALGFAAVIAAGWYVASVAATAGDWLWPVHLLSAIGAYYGPDTSYNSTRAISIPGLLVGNGAPPFIAWVLVAGTVAAAVPRLMRASIVEAAAGVCLLGLAVSPHALNYEAALALPAILWTMGGTGAGIREPARTRLIVASCVAGMLILVGLWLGVSIIGIAVLAMTFIWISGWQRLEVAERTTSAGEEGPNRAVRGRRLRATPGVSGTLGLRRTFLAGAADRGRLRGLEGGIHLAEVSVCGRCGTRSWAGTPFCYSCGQSLAADQPPVAATAAAPAAPAPAPATATAPAVAASEPAAAWVPAPTPAYVPPGGSAAQQAARPNMPSATPVCVAPGQMTPGVDQIGRPFGVAMLAFVEVVVGVVGLYVIYDFFYWADWRFTYDGTPGIFWGAVDAAFGLAYIATTITAFSLVTRLWKLQAGAWLPANLLSLASIVLIVVPVVIWGSESLLDPIGVVAHLSVLAYLNLTHVRKLFGRAPLATLQAAT